MCIFSGSGVALVTPFKNGEVDYKKFAGLIERQIENKTDAIVVCGTTGEPSTMPIPEHLNVIDYAIKTVAGRVPVIAGTGSNCTETAIELSKAAQSMGADALLLVTPYYNKCSQEGLYRHYMAVADSVEIPLVLYNVPSRTGVNIKPETLSRLADHENIAAVKEACGNITQIAQTARLVRGRMDLYSGNDDQTVPIMSLGALGVISVVANVLPRETHDMAAAALVGDFKKALDLQFYLDPLIDALFWDVSPIFTKMALDLMGLCGSEMRLPLCEGSPEMKEKLAGILKSYKLI